MYSHLLGPFLVGSEGSAEAVTGKHAVLLGLLLLELNRPVPGLATPTGVDVATRDESGTDACRTPR